MKLQIKKLTSTAKIPTYGREGDAAFDFYADESITIPAKDSVKVSTGVAIAFPDGYVLLFRDRSSMSFKYGITMLGGVFDSNYRGEYKIKLYNTSDVDYKIEQGDKVVSGLLLKRPTVEFEEVDELDDTNRGTSGFGSSGK